MFYSTIKVESLKRENHSNQGWTLRWRQAWRISEVFPMKQEESAGTRVWRWTGADVRQEADLNITQSLCKDLKWDFLFYWDPQNMFLHLPLDWFNNGPKKHPLTCTVVKRSDNSDQFAELRFYLSVTAALPHCFSLQLWTAEFKKSKVKSRMGSCSGFSPQTHGTTSLQSVDAQRAEQSFSVRRIRGEKTTYGHVNEGWRL